MKDSFEKDQKQFFQALPVDSFQFDYTLTRTNFIKTTLNLTKNTKKLRTF